MRKFIILLCLLFSSPSWSQTVYPADRTHTSAVQPLIVANFGVPVHNARIWVDGREFTQYARTQNGVVELIPPYRLDFGVHTVQVNSTAGNAAWSFAIVDPQGQRPTSIQFPGTPYYPVSAGYPPQYDYEKAQEKAWEEQKRLAEKEQKAQKKAWEQQRKQAERAQEAQQKAWDRDNDDDDDDYDYDDD